MLTHLLALLLLTDALKLWRRAVSYPQLGPRTDHAQAPALLGEYTIIAAPGVSVPEHVYWRAAQWADDEGVLVVDLLPEGWSAPDALAQLNKLHPIDYALKPFSKGATAGVAVLVHQRVLARVTPPEASEGYLAWLDFARELKRYAPWESALVVATDWRQERPKPSKPQERRAALSDLYGPTFEATRWLSPLIWAWLAYTFVTQPLYGGALLALWLAQPALILARTPLKANWLPYALPRPFTDLARWWQLLGSLPERGEPGPSEEERRASYKAMMARGEGLERGEGVFFEEERHTCPLCDSSQLTPHLELTDFYQNKPGLFKLHRCGECDHIFQNPRLSIEGLEFYYRDFYDGLGEAGMDTIFGASEQSYRQRVSMIRAHGAPERWLDVGGGHGHFTLIAQHLMPQTRFDLLDLSSSVEQAAARGWCEQGVRGLFPELAPELKGVYDGVSMSHYLEHTTDPLKELDAAALALKPQGLLMIEVPDPGSSIGQLLRSWWLPWFQPQHLHFMSVDNLSHALEERGFDVLDVDRSEAHQSVDLFFAALILIQRIAPDAHKPWCAPPSALARLKRGLVLTLSLPLILLATALDHLLRPLLARPGWSNTYRLLAQKTEDTPEEKLGEKLEEQA